MADTTHIINVIPLILMMLLVLIGFVYFLSVRSKEKNMSNEEDPRQQATRIILIVTLIGMTWSSIAAWFVGLPAYLDMSVAIVSAMLIFLIPKKPRLTRYLTIFLLVVGLVSFGIENLFSPTNMVYLIYPIICAGLLFEVWEMLGFMGIITLGYIYLREQFYISTLSGQMEILDLYTQFTFFSVGFISTVISSTLTRAFYREQALRKAQEQMLRTVCHELRTPVAAMRSFWAATRMEGMNVSLGLVEPLADGAQQHTEYLHQLTEQVVQIVRGRQTRLPKEWVDIADTARRSVSQMELLSQTRGMSISLDIHDEPLTVWTTNEWQIVFVNLIDNALRHSHGKQIQITLQKKNDLPIITVLDDGKGMPFDPQIVMQPWVRYDQSSAKGISQGLGLGWTIIQDICLRNQARISVGTGIGGQGLGVTIRFEGPGLFTRLVQQPIERFARKHVPFLLR